MLPEDAPFEAIHVRSSRRDEILRAVATFAGGLGLKPVPLDPILDRQERADRWHAVVAPERNGWVTLWPEAMADPDALMRAITAALGCGAWIAAGQPAFLWAFEVASGGATLARWRSDDAPDGEERAAVASAVAGLTDGPPDAVEALLDDRPEAEAYSALCEVLGCQDDAGDYDALAEPVLAGEHPDHDLVSYSRSGLVRPSAPRSPKAPKPV